jgi:hypothetical protein
MGYGGTKSLQTWQRFANSFDLVIHEIPAPKEDEEQWWLGIYNIDPPQIIAAHDAHFREFYPHINLIAHRITAITCTNHAGYVALEHCTIPRAFIGAAHQLEDWDRQPPWDKRPVGSICAHVWKAWKHMDKVVAAGPLLQRSSLIMAGDGIEGRYMRSKEKVKPKYAGLWDAFEKSQRCMYEGMVNKSYLFSLYLQRRVMVDMSYSAKFAALGNHFNRSILEAANCGCIAICTVENMAENNPQVELFKDGVTHVGVHQNIAPNELAEVMDWACNDVHPDGAAQMVANCRKILADHFDYRKTCLQYLELAKGSPAGIYPRLERGKMPGATGT